MNIWELETNPIVQVGAVIGVIAILTILSQRTTPSYSVSGENKADWVYTGP